jgi:HK97 family phage prohead protease
MNCRCNTCDFTVEDYQVKGIAAPYEKLSKDLGGFREVIARGAFDSVLKKNPSVVAVLDHSRESHKILGSTDSGTLQLRSTELGLEFSLDIAKTQTGADVIELLKRGDVSKMSFAFSGANDKWSTYGKESIRTIYSFDELHDVSIVSEPAYIDTQVS